jgi:glyoxylase-like metal-dependent hydrolase (beta-lactamase superfamily II)
MITPIKQKDVSAILKNIKNTSELKVKGCVCICNGVACDCDCSNGCNCDCNCDCKKPEKPEDKRVQKLFLSLVFTAVLLGSGAAAQNNNETLAMTFEIGDSQVSVLSEEQRNGRVDALAGVTPEMIRTYLPDSVYPSAVNAFLIRTPDKNILVDAGYGRKLFDNMQSLGVSAEDVHIILLTHMHADHIGGLLRDERAAFPKAELYLPQPEYDYWMSDQAMQASPDRRNGFLQARKVLSSYKDKLHLFVPDDIDAANAPSTLLPGVRGVAAYGHTPGHTAYLIESEGAHLLIWGDLTHAMRIQMPCPDVTYARDANPAQSIETRKRILSYVAEKNIPIAGMHIAFPGIGDVIPTGNGGEYTFEPYCLCLGF